jgi:hypothetical protein
MSNSNAELDNIINIIMKKRIKETTLTPKQKVAKLQKFYQRLSDIKEEINELIKVNKAEQTAFDVIASYYGKAFDDDISFSLTKNRKKVKGLSVTQRYAKVQTEAYDLIQEIRAFYTEQDLLYGIGYDFGDNDKTQLEMVIITGEEYSKIAHPHTRSEEEGLEQTVKDYTANSKTGLNDKKGSFKIPHASNKDIKTKASELFKQTIQNAIKKGRSIKIGNEYQLFKDNRKNKNIARAGGRALEDYFKYAIHGDSIDNILKDNNQDNINAFRGGDDAYEYAEGKYVLIQLKMENASTGVSMNLMIHYVDRLLKAIKSIETENDVFEEEFNDLFIKKIDETDKNTSIIMNKAADKGTTTVTDVHKGIPEYVKSNNIHF